MRFARAYLAISSLVLFTWITLILIIKSIEAVIAVIPSSLLRSIVGLSLYGIWGLIIIAAIKLILNKLSAIISENKPPP